MQLNELCKFYNTADTTEYMEATRGKWKQNPQQLADYQNCPINKMHDFIKQNMFLKKCFILSSTLKIDSVSYVMNVLKGTIVTYATMVYCTYSTLNNF